MDFKAVSKTLDSEFIMTCEMNGNGDLTGYIYDGPILKREVVGHNISNISWHDFCALMENELEELKKSAQKEFVIDFIKERDGYKFFIHDATNGELMAQFKDKKLDTVFGIMRDTIRDRIEG